MNFHGSSNLYTICPKTSFTKKQKGPQKIKNFICNTNTSFSKKFLKFKESQLDVVCPSLINDYNSCLQLHGYTSSLEILL